MFSKKVKELPQVKMEKGVLLMLFAEGLMAVKTRFKEKKLVSLVGNRVAIQDDSLTMSRLKP